VRAPGLEPGARTADSPSVTTTGEPPGTRDLGDGATAVLRALPDPALLLDPAGRVRACNAALERLTGTAPAPGTSAEDALPGLPGLAGAVALAVADPDAGPVLNGRLATHRGPVPVGCTVRPVAGARGATGGVLVVLSDRSRPEGLARRLRAAREAGLDGFVLLEVVRDGHGRAVDAVVVDCNERAAAGMGRPRAALMGARTSEVTPDPRRVAELLADYEDALGGGLVERETVYQAPDGPRRFRYQLSAHDGLVAVLSRDRTDEHRAEEERRRVAEQFAFISRSAGDLIMLCDAAGMIVHANHAAVRLLGRNPGELGGVRGIDLVHPHDRPVADEQNRRLLRGESESEAATYRTVRPDGTVVTLDTTLAVLRDDAGEVTRYVCVARDAAPRLEAQRMATEQVARSNRRAAEQASLRRVATAAATGAEPASVMEVIARELTDVLDVECGLVVRLEGGACRLVGAVDPERRVAVGRSMPVGDTVLLQPVFTLLRPARIRQDAAQAAAAVFGFREAAAAPVRAGGRVWGAVVAATRRRRRLPEDAEARLARFAELVAIAVSATESRSQLTTRALTDPLTGLPNHRAFHERLRAEAARARRHGRRLSLAMMDLDHFKRLNDVHGHPVGDLVLAEVARRMREGGRTGELMGRVGGEEFAWLMPETGAEDARDAVERLRQAISSTPVVDGVGVTLSAGVCDLHAAGGSADELVRLADGALYWAKANGRDQCCAYSPEVVGTLSAEERAERLERTQALLALRSLARAVDAKDPATRAHSERVAEHAHRLALRLGWPAARAALLREAALIHDVGKIGVRDAVLLKAGPLDAAEHEAVRAHAALGAQIADEVLCPEQVAWIRHHHERWDGAGYPAGLAGEAVPDGARILAVADAWDVMTAARRRDGAVRPHDEAVAELRRCAGTQFAPEVVAAMEAVLGAAAAPATPPPAGD
jgi:diguanylate cyclase (GGDEF)-like protein/PAS domain S-box-containing protein